VDCDVVVIGAGLAGLRCADRLAKEGRSVVLLDGADAVGGRQRTDEVDGLLLDRGFQVLNPAYPAVRRWVDVDALDLHTFGAGLLVRREHGLVTLSHPLRHPSGVPGTVRGFEIAVTKYGKRTWAENMAPAVELATKGFPVSPAIAFAIIVFPVPGGPHRRIPPGTFPPRDSIASGFSR